jgi:uncharacterized protein YqeY
MRERISQAMKDALKSGDKPRLAALRLMLAAIKEHDIAIQMETSGKPGARSGLDDAELLQVLQKMVKQRRESAETYLKGGRPELAAQEQAEITVIEAFLPRQMSEGDMRAAVETVAKELGATTVKDMGKTMAELKKRYSGQMDFAKASAIARELLK